MKERTKAHLRELGNWRSQIIKSVFEKGLKDGSALSTEGQPYLGSADPMPPSWVEGCNFYPRSLYSNAEDFQKSLLHDLYFGPRSIFPVVVERPSSKEALLRRRAKEKEGEFFLRIKAKYEKRVVASFLVVTEGTNLAIRQEVEPDLFLYACFPKAIWDGLSQDIRESLPGIPMKFISGLIKRTLVYDLSVPDYESAITEILQEVGRPIWVHAVRLPTEDDFG